MESPVTRTRRGRRTAARSSSSAAGGRARVDLDDSPGRHDRTTARPRLRPVLFALWTEDRLRPRRRCLLHASGRHRRAAAQPPSGRPDAADSVTDGRQILFTVFSQTAHRAAVWTMRADGTERAATDARLIRRGGRVVARPDADPVHKDRLLRERRTRHRHGDARRRDAGASADARGRGRVRHQLAGRALTPSPAPAESDLANRAVASRPRPWSWTRRRPERGSPHGLRRHCRTLAQTGPADAPGHRQPRLLAGTRTSGSPRARAGRPLPSCRLRGVNAGAARS